jgi:hypothetical protein
MDSKLHKIFIEDVSDIRLTQNRDIYDQLHPAWNNRILYSNLETALIQAIAIVDLKYRKEITDLKIDIEQLKAKNTIGKQTGGSKHGSKRGSKRAPKKK